MPFFANEVPSGTASGRSFSFRFRFILRIPFFCDAEATTLIVRALTDGAVERRRRCLCPLHPLQRFSVVDFPIHLSGSTGGGDKMQTSTTDALLRTVHLFSPAPARVHFKARVSVVQLNLRTIVFLSEYVEAGRSSLPRAV